MIDYNLQAKALLEAAQALKNAKRNKSGTINGNAITPIMRKLSRALIESGEESNEAFKMTWELINKYRKNPDHK